LTGEDIADGFKLYFELMSVVWVVEAIGEMKCAWHSEQVVVSARWTSDTPTVDGRTIAC
jgi:hypothetical protein